MKKADCPHGDYYAACDKCYNEWREKMSTKVKVLQFFELDSETQSDLVKMYNKRQQILSRMEGWRKESELLNIELGEIRLACQHPLVEITRKNDTDEYGKMLKSGWIEYKCPDCGFRSSEPFDNG